MEREKKKTVSFFQAIKFHSRGFPSGANDGIYDIAGWTPLINVGRRRACCIKSHCTHKTLSYCRHCELRILTESEKSSRAFCVRCDFSMCDVKE